MVLCSPKDNRCSAKSWLSSKYSFSKTPILNLIEFLILKMRTMITLEFVNVHHLNMIHTCLWGVSLKYESI